MLSHARSALEKSTDVPPRERARCFQDFLKIESWRLLSLHRSGGGGLEVVHRRSVMMDNLLHYVLFSAVHSVSRPMAGNGALPEMCLVATGGYGRRELSPFSDVDILFLLASARGPDLARSNEIVQQVLYALWDLGLKVGHATRTINECVAQARKDMQSRTALLEGRLLEGASAVFATFQRTLYQDCLQGRAKQYIAERMKDQEQRHAKFGSTVFVQEPNVKNGCGGLRDLQNLLWIARFQAGASTLEELQQAGHLAQIEAGRLNRAYDYLLRVRNELHYTQGHAVDEIALSFQPKIAEALGYHQKDVLLRIEMFMRDYYRHARDIYLFGEALSERLSIEEPPGRRLRRWSSLFSFGKDTEKLDGNLVLRNGVLGWAEDAPAPSDPHELMHIFHTAQLRGARIGAKLQSLIRASLKLVDRGFLYSRRARDTFLSILHAKGEVSRTLRMMHECEFLGEYLPEFGRLDCLVQHEFYHRYTADEHTLLAIEKLDEVLGATHVTAGHYRRLFQQLERPHLLYLAILLHDTGKGSHVRHHTDASAICAQRVARRFCLDQDAYSLLVWLVDHHMTMSSIAQRRDVEDPATAEDFRQIVENRERLDMLHLLTFVDGQAVGGTFWNEWRQAALWELFEQTAKSLDMSGIETVSVEEQKRVFRQAIAPRLSPVVTADEVEAHFAYMPARYWRRVDEDRLVWHLENLHIFFEKLQDAGPLASSPAVHWKHFPDRAYSEVVVGSWDRHGLLAKIAGSFAAVRINILSADVYTRGDDLVLDIFQVCDLEHRCIQDDEQLKKMTVLLADSLVGEAQVSFIQEIHEEYESMRHKPHQEEERFPTTIVVNNEDSKDYTIIEIQTPDRLGLLYHVLEVLSRCGLDIGLAKINTEKGAAMDVFYVTDTEGNKVSDPSWLDRIRQELTGVVDKLNQPFRVITEPKG